MDDYFKEEVFNWLSVKYRDVISMSALPGVQYDTSIECDRTFDNYVNDIVVCIINARVLGKELPSFKEVESEFFNTPKNPWQHFKDMYADKWFMRSIAKRWPVKFNQQKVTLTTEWKQWAVYPWMKNVPATPHWQPVRVILPATTRITKEDFEEGNGTSNKML